MSAEYTDFHSIFFAKNITEKIPPQPRKNLEYSRISLLRILGISLLLDFFLGMD